MADPIQSKEFYCAAFDFALFLSVTDNIRISKYIGQVNIDAISGDVYTLDMFVNTG